MESYGANGDDDIIDITEEYITVTIAESTPEPPAPAAEGYTVSLPADAIQATTGADVTVPVTIGHTDSSVEKYNAFDMSFSYDASVLTAVTDGYGENVTATAANGVLRVQRYGADADLGDFDLQFTAAAAGSSTVTVTDARIDAAAYAATRDTPTVASGAPDPDTGEGAATATVNVTAATPAEYEITWEGNALDDITTSPRPETVTEGEDLVFTVNKAEGYTYTVSTTSGSVVEDPDGTYTISDVSENVTVTVNKTANAPAFTAEASLYIHLDGIDFYLIKVTGDPGEDKTFCYDGAPMYLAANYSANTTETIYSYLVIVNAGETAPDDAAATALVTITDDAAAGTIAAGNYDINGTGLVDVNDAQLVYNMYTGEYSDFNTVGMEKVLAADVNADSEINSADAVAIVAEAV